MQDRLSMTLYTLGAILRPWKTEDAAWYVAARDEEIFRFTTERRELTVEETEEAILRINASNNVISWAIADRDTLELLGNIALVIDRGEATAEAHYFLSPEGRGRGIATGALKTVCEWVFVNLEVERVILGTFPGNVRSQRVAQRAGFQHTQVNIVTDGNPDFDWFELRK